MTAPFNVVWFAASMMFVTAFAIASDQSGLRDAEIVRAKQAFDPNGFKSFGDYRWDNPLCDAYDHGVGRCVGLYQDDRLSIYPLKDAFPNGDYGHAIIHGLVKFTKKDLEYGERNKWIGSTKYGEIYTLEAGYIFLPKRTFPAHILFSKECRSIRIKLIAETAEIVRDVMTFPKRVGEIIVEYPLGYDDWHSRYPFVIQSMCFVESRSYKDSYQPYLGPLAPSNGAYE